MQRRTLLGSSSLSGLPLLDLLSRVEEGLDADASLEYAHRLFHGLAVSPDAVAAARQLEVATELGSLEAMYNLSICYLRGLGVRRNLALSRYWAMACERGHDYLGGQRREDGADTQVRAPEPRFRSRAVVATK